MSTTAHHHTSGAAACASAPGKVILFGEHFVVHGTDAILCAINRRVSITATETANGVKIRSCIGNINTDSLDAPINSIKTALRPLYYIAQTASRRAGFRRGINLDVTSEIPSGAGLGSSSACCAAGAAAVLRLLGLDASREKVLGLAVDAERVIFPDASGADTAASVLGGMLTYSRQSGYTNIPFDSPPGFGLIVANSGIIHDTEHMVRQVENHKKRNSSEFSLLCQKESELILKVLEILRGHDSLKAAELGRMATRNQSYLESIGVSNERLGEMIRVMRSLTYGAKITGAGGGGCAIAFTKEDRLAKIYDELIGRGYDCFAAKIDCAGLNTF